MFATRFVLAALALVNVALAGAPPACLLGAIQGLPNPADMSAVCDKYQTSVTGNLTVVCSGDDVQSAYSAYSATCSLNGVKVKALATSSAEASSAAATAKTTATGTGKTTATAKATASTKTGTSTATATGAAATESGDSTSGATTASQPVAFMVSGLLALGVANLLLL
ncbi:hypothetical protein F503_00424 [Ophiostoma piceae UAMH 11346]|uniref:Gpi anchored cell wall protein n=1 Tax=Ophiostoma piceae (strain UAMH 11346) TaxID=1262450 RepID=S3C4J2_OPHP1|nr:hypothetical protein F503_00424 [Ophiostoma piceae UAMH 11346]